MSSSLRYKEDVSDMGESSGRLMDLNPVTFRYKNAYENGDKPLQYGLIAEEVAEVFPDLVVFNDEGQPETIKYHVLSSLLLNELQVQYQVNQAQEDRLGELKDEVAELRVLVGQIAALQAVPSEKMVALNVKQ
jgi:hypothetical protein